ncbi:MAG: thiamine phosphate synthase [Thermodesulfobacteriota bacterium]
MKIEGIYLVTDRKSCAPAGIEDVVLQAVEGGVSVVQLREKELDTRRFVEEALRLRSLLKPKGVPLLINDRIDVALASGADGVHIGQSDMPYPLARRLLGKQALIGLSVENEEQLMAAEMLDVDYLGVSAIFPTATKVDTKHYWGLEGLLRARRISSHRLVAIGGIGIENAAAVLEAGADALAVVSAICAADRPAQAAMALHEIYRTTRKPHLDGTKAAYDGYPAST